MYAQRPAATFTDYCDRKTAAGRGNTNERGYLTAKVRSGKTGAADGRRAFCVFAANGHGRAGKNANNR